MSQAMSLFPIFVKLEGRPVLLVGGGPVGESKVAGFSLRVRSVTVVAPEATPAIVELARQGKLRWHRRKFRAERSRRRDARRRSRSQRCRERGLTTKPANRGVLCNSVDDIDNCDFYYPAVVTRGDLQIAISTGGHSPALAQRLRMELEQQFGPEYADWIQQLGRRAARAVCDRHGSGGAQEEAASSWLRREHPGSERPCVPRRRGAWRSRSCSR